MLPWGYSYTSLPYFFISFKSFMNINWSQSGLKICNCALNLLSDASFKFFNQSSKHQHALPEIFNGGKIQIFAWIGVNKFFFANIIADIRYGSKVIKGNICKKSFSKTICDTNFFKFCILFMQFKNFQNSTT